MPALAAPLKSSASPARPQQSHSPPSAAPLRPLPGESQSAYLDRCLRTLPGAVSEKSRYALESWAAAGGDAPLQQAAASKFPPLKFRHVRNRPVFVEHAKTRTITDPITGAAHEVQERYDRQALEDIIDRCNERILDTGDFAPITAGHTPDRAALDRGEKMPDVLGYAGPYRLGMVGNVHPKYAIFCDEWHHADETERLNKLQRRSPEVWMEEQMRDRFFDPIAALGAETPRLDMGLTQFARTSDGRLIEKYSSVPVAPSGSSTFIPGDGGERRREDYEAQPSEDIDPQKARQILRDGAVHGKPLTEAQRKVFGAAAGRSDNNTADAAESEGESLMLAPEDLQQIVAAIDQLDWVQGVKEMLAAHDAGDMSDMNGGGAPPIEANAALPPAQNRAMWAQVTASGEGRGGQGTRNKDGSYDQDAMRQNWGDEYNAGAAGIPVAPQVPGAGVPQPFARYEADDDDHEMLAGFMSGDKTNDEVMEYMRGKRAKYEAAAEGSVENGDAGKPAGAGTVIEEKVAYARNREGGKHVDYATKYARLERENRELSGRLTKIESEKRDQYRKARLNEKLAEGVVFDYADEWDITQDMTDDQFEKHVTRVIEKYERVPLSDRMPQLYTPHLPNLKTNERYNKERADKITKFVLREREKGNAMSYDEAAEKIDGAA